MAFIDDIQSRDTALYPVVIFETSDTGDDVQVSIKPVTISDRTFSPLLLSSPSIKESIDLENRKYKISNVSLKISNVEYNGERFSDRISSYDYLGNGNFRGAINTECEIYWISPSVEDSNIQFGGATNEAYKAFHGVVRAITHDEKTCNITLEDISQSTLHRDVPVSLLGTSSAMLDKYKNKPVPMVYGYVDKSPMVVDNSSGSYVLRADSQTIESFEKELSSIFDTTLSSLYISADDEYYNVVEIIKRNFDYLDDLYDPITVGTTTQFAEDLDNSSIILHNTALIKTPAIQCELILKPKTILLNDILGTDLGGGTPSNDIQNFLDNHAIDSNNLFSDAHIIGLTDNDYSTVHSVNQVSSSGFNDDEEGGETHGFLIAGAALKFDMTPTADFHASELQDFAFDQIILPPVSDYLLLDSNSDITNEGLGDFIILGAEDEDGVTETIRVSCFGANPPDGGDYFSYTDPFAALIQEFATDEGNSYTILTGGTWYYQGDGTNQGWASITLSTFLNMKEVDYRSLVDLKTPLNKIFYANIRGRTTP